MRHFFEKFTLGFSIPKLNVIQKFLQERDSTLNFNYNSSPQKLEGLSKFVETLEDKSRDLILQGEFMWMIISLNKLRSEEEEIKIEDPYLVKVLSTLKFLIWFSKFEPGSSIEKRIPLSSRFLDSQVFIDEKERSAMVESDNNTSEETPVFYDIDFSKPQINYLVRVPIALSLENLDVNMTLSVNLVSPIGETTPMPLFVSNNFGNFLSHQFKLSNDLKNEKPYLLVDKREVKVTNIFDCSSNIDDFGDKKFISIKIKNKLNEVILYSSQDKKEEAQLYIENIDFLIQNSLSKAIYNIHDRERINSELNDTFTYKIIGEKLPIVLNADSEFNLVIIVQQAKQYDFKSEKYLCYSFGEIETLEQDESKIEIQKFENNEIIPGTPSQNPFSKKNENLSFKAVLGSKSSSDRSPMATATNTSRAKFDANFFNLESQASIRYSNSSSEISSPKEKQSSQQIYSTIQSEKQKKTSFKKNDNKWLYSQSVDSKSKIVRLNDTGCSVFMSTPLIIKWNINKLFSTSSIFRVIWNNKDVEVLKVACRTLSNYYTLKDVIELEIEVENKSINTLELELLPPSEVLQFSASSSKEKNQEENLQQKNDDFNFDKMEYETKRNILENQVVAISREKFISFGAIENKEKVVRKMTLQPINYGMIRLDYLVFYERKSDCYIKINTPIFFVVS